MLLSPLATCIMSKLEHASSVAPVLGALPYFDDPIRVTAYDAMNGKETRVVMIGKRPSEMSDNNYKIIPDHNWQNQQNPDPSCPVIFSHLIIIHFF